MKQGKLVVKALPLIAFLLLLFLVPLVSAHKYKNGILHRLHSTIWGTSDIGSAKMHGSMIATSSGFTLQGSGGDIWGHSDQFQYVYYKMQGNGQLIAHMLSHTASDGWAKAGIMARETLTAESANVFLLMTPHHGVTFQQRAATGKRSTQVMGPQTKAPQWMKLVRENETITGWISDNGVHWIKVMSTIVRMPMTIYIGLAAASHDPATRSEVLFTNVSLSIISLPPTPSPTPSPTPIPILSSSTGTLHGTYQFNFDHGVEGPGDVFWEQMTTTQRAMIPMSSAKLYNIGVVDFDGITRSQLQSYIYSTTPIDGSDTSSNQLVVGDVFAVQTTGGNYAKVKIVSYGYNLQIQWVTYAG